MNREHIYLLHGRGGSPYGTVKHLQDIISARQPGRYYRPRLPHHDAEVEPLEAFRLFQKQIGRHMETDALLIGVSLGGLVAARLQEQMPKKRFRVFAINAPTHAGKLKLDTVDDRTVLYSSHDKVIDGRTDWSRYTKQAFDLPWLVHDLDPVVNAVSMFVTAYMRGDDLRDLVRSFNQVHKVGLEKAP